MFSLVIGGVELGIGVGVLAALWFIISFFAYLFWWRYMRETILDSKNIMSKVGVVILLSLLLTLIVLAIFFSLVQHTLEVTYTYPLNLVHKFY
jgi:hypothetical protein